MKRWIKISAVSALVLVIGASVVTVRALVPAGQFTTLREIVPVSCGKLPGAVGAEDFALDRESGRAYVSSLDRRKLAQGDKSVRGEIYALDLSQSGDPPPFRALTGGMPADFRPHGVAFYRGDDGGKRLFAVNHRSDGTEAIEIFAIEGDTLTHLRTIKDRVLGTPNDIVAVGPEEFYVTDDGGRSDFIRGIDMVFQRQRTGIVYYDGETARPVADGFVYANGIAKSPDGRTIYAADTSGYRLLFYRRDGEGGGLTEIGRLVLGSSLDNIIVDEKGALWIAAHPKPIDLFRHFKTGEPAPSQVIKAMPNPDGGGTVRTVFLDPDGSLISAASVGGGYRGRLLVGAIFDSHMLLCILQKDAS